MSSQILSYSLDAYLPQMPEDHPVDYFSNQDYSSVHSTPQMRAHQILENMQQQSFSHGSQMNDLQAYSNFNQYDNHSQFNYTNGHSQDNYNVLLAAATQQTQSDAHNSYSSYDYSMEFPSTHSINSSITSSDGYTHRIHSSAPDHPYAQRQTSPQSSKRYECPRTQCTKVYKNSNGLKYHIEHGNCEVETSALVSEVLGETVQTTTDLKVVNKPFYCKIGECGKRYKNLNGLKYHARINHGEMDFEMHVKGVLL